MKKLICTVANTKPRFDKQLFFDIQENLSLVSEDDSHGTLLKFAAYMRTADTNEVVVNNETGGDFAFYSSDAFASSMFTKSGLDYPYPLFLSDASLLFCKCVFDSIFPKDKITEEEYRRLVLNSSCFPVGAFCDGKCFYVVSNIIENSGVLNTNTKLDGEFSLVPISDVLSRDYCDGSSYDYRERFVRETLVVSKGGIINDQ